MQKQATFFYALTNFYIDETSEYDRIRNADGIIYSSLTLPKIFTYTTHHP